MELKFFSTSEWSSELELLTKFVVELYLLRQCNNILNVERLIILCSLSIHLQKLKVVYNKNGPDLLKSQNFKKCSSTKTACNI